MVSAPLVPTSTWALMTDSVTISLLPVSLALVHLPRSRLDTLSHHVLRQILRPNPTFLNLTCNEIELSLFAEHHALHDFEKIARKDARKLKMRGREGRGEPPGEQEPRKRCRHLRENWEPVEMSSDKWSVLQIDSHSDQLDNSGARVRELSAPLAAAGISILYQSSYMSDFIFVKSFRLSQVMSLLASAGFDLYSSDPRNLTAQLSTFTSPLLSPAADDSISIHLLDLAAMSTMSLQQGNSIDPDGGAVFTRSRSSTNSSSASSQSRGQPVPPHLQMSNPLDFSIGLPTANDRTEAEDMDPNTPASPPRPSVSRAQSHSPSGCDVRVLPPDLTYIGLADDSADMWGLKIVKLVAFPELIAGLSGQTVDGASHSSSPVPVSMHDSIILPSGQMHIAAAIEGETESGSDTTTRVGLDSPKQDPELRASSESPLFDLTRSRASDDDPDDDLDNNSSDEDGYFSASPRRSTEEHPSLEEYSDTSCVSESPAKSNTGRPLLPHHDTFNTVNTIHPFNDDHDHIATRSRSRSVSVSSNLSNSRTLSPLVPFFSFTRTSEGSSLTAPVPLLAKLFPPSERHMVICSDELDIMDSRNASPTVDNVEDLDSEQDEMEAQGPLRCLQIDLRKFGLDKHGLVNRFSRTLEENGINHMYNSTYKTANLLVDRAHASHAQALLRSC